MARKGENIYKRKDGRWEARYIKEHPVGGKVRYGYCYARSYRDVKDKVAGIRMKVKAEAIAPSANKSPLFTHCCDAWLQIKRITLKASTYVKYDSILERYIKPMLGSVPFDAISTQKVEGFAHYLLSEKALSPKTVKDILVLLKSILTYSAKHYPGPKPETEILYPKEVRKEMRVLSVEEEKKLIEYLLTDTDPEKFGVLLALSTGLRIGELCALRWANISLEEKTLHVTASMQRLRDMEGCGAARTKIIISQPKSDHSVRAIPLTEPLTELCRRFISPCPEAFVLSGSVNTFVEPRALQYKLAVYTKACGLERVHFHTLRHSFATRCIEVDFELKALSEILGHSSPKVTLERYVHTSMELKRTNMNKLTNIGF